MKAWIVAAALLVGQNTFQDKPVVHLHVNSALIDGQFGGKLLELKNSPPQLYLPGTPPKTDSAGNPWIVDVKNLGPNPVSITGSGMFSVHVNSGQTVHIFADGAVYRLKH